MSRSNNKLFVLIPCAGRSTRFGHNIPKQYTKIMDKSIVWYTLQVFLAIPNIEQIMLVVNIDDEYINSYQALSPKIVIARVGGEYRAQSVFNGLKQLSCKDDDWILVHDVARCCITSIAVNRLITQVIDDPVGGILAIPVRDTLKIGHNGIIVNTVERQNMYLAQTPQMFRYHILFNALSQSDLTNITDEASSIESLNLPIKLIEGDVDNIKITYLSDILLASKILQREYH